MPSTTSLLIGRQVRLRREQRRLSAAELARRADLSKATLSALEGGSGNPTIDTLEALAVALAVPLTDLLVAETESGAIVRRATAGDSTDIQRELLVRVRGPHALESWRLRMPPHHEFDGVPHATGTVEQLFIARGQVTAGPIGSEEVLRAGDLLSFAADAPHRYLTGSRAADIHVLLATPAR